VLAGHVLRSVAKTTRGDHTENDRNVDDEEDQVHEIALAREDAPRCSHDCCGALWIDDMWIYVMYCKETRHGCIGKEGCNSCLGTGHPLASGWVKREFIGREPARTSINMSATATLRTLGTIVVRHNLLCVVYTDSDGA
jgi:hypothetical protein